MINTILESQNYPWIIAIIVYSVLEILRGKIPFLNRSIPFGLEYFKKIDPKVLKIIVIAGSALLNIIVSVFSPAGIPESIVNTIVSSLAAYGIHEAVDIVPNDKKNS